MADGDSDSDCVLFAALLGTWLLKEKFGLQRALGTAVVVAGVIGLRLA